MPATDLLSTFHALPDLRQEVDRLIAQIPFAQITTYGDLARALGDDRARAARWLGEYLKNHPHPPGCPCHRVVRSNGEIGLHVSNDPQFKATLLRSEGVAVSDTGTVSLESRFQSFQSGRPLDSLRTMQQQMGRQVREEPLVSKPSTFGGVDVAYAADGTACGAYVLLDASTLEVLETLTTTQAAAFPYIPGYLTWRELPIMLQLCEEARSAGVLGDVVFVDGNGALHPWRAGIATCLGVALDHPVIGIGKSLLCGQVDLKGLGPQTPRPVRHEGQTIGRALRAHETSRPFYVSVGNRLSLRGAVRLTRQVLGRGRLPEPIVRADRLTKRLRTRH